MIDYGEFLAGLSKGLQALWQPDFMTGVRNGGFEQTLRNVCIPHIERATGKMAFTESRGRADLLLCGDEADTCTRCEFKVNFAPQYGEILKRKREAIDQVRTQAGYRTPAFAPLFSRDGISFEWEKNWARLHVWTHHDT
jgi:hypothetical protein